MTEFVMVLFLTFDTKVNGKRVAWSASYQGGVTTQVFKSETTCKDALKEILALAGAHMNGICVKR